MHNLLPRPRQVTEHEGVFAVKQGMYICMGPNPGMLMRTAARQLQADIRARCGFTPMVTIGKGKPGDVLLMCARGYPQGYQLAIRDGAALVTGNDDAGVLHGAQTLRQIIRRCGANWPCVTIRDEPAFPARGFYHDQTRGRIATLDYLKSLADDLCLFKMNQLQLYVEHTYLFRDIPELWPVAGTPLSPQDIIELDDYCFERGIELVPSLSSFGHLLELLRLPRFADLCEMEGAADYPSSMPCRMAHHTINPSDERAFALIAAMIDEFLPLFRSSRFNVCADETFDLGKGRNQGRDVRELYMGFLTKLCVHVTEQGKTPMFWGDIVLKYPEALAGLPDGAICLNWGYSPNETEHASRAFADARAVQYVCPGTSAWNRIVPMLRTSHENIRRMAGYGRKYGAIGLLNTDWGDYGHIADPRLSLPGMIAGACAAWGNLPDAEALFQSISRLVYGDESGECLRHVADLAEAQAYTWWHIVQHKEWTQGRVNCPESPMPRLAPDRLAQAEDAVDRAVRALQHGTANAADVSRFLLAAEGVRVWNRVADVAASGGRDAVLSRELLAWLNRYEAQWREVSRESELWRIRDVACWYADAIG